jgi:hypothetical protein
VIPDKPKEEDYFYANPQECLRDPDLLRAWWYFSCRYVVHLPVPIFRNMAMLNWDCYTLLARHREEFSVCYRQGLWLESRKDGAADLKAAGVCVGVIEWRGCFLERGDMYRWWETFIIPTGRLLHFRFV